MNATDKAALVSVETATSDVITLVEGTTREELLHSRVTQLEVRKRLYEVDAALTTISEPTKAAFPELDYAAWREVCARVRGGGDAAGGALWFAVQALVPATLEWIRVYQAEKPEWFV